MKKILVLILVFNLIMGVMPVESYADNKNYSIQNTLDFINEGRDNLNGKVKNVLDKGEDYFKQKIRKFSDMGTHWSDITVGKLVELGVISGYTDGTFKPNDTITRAEFATITRKSFMLDEINGNSFTDTKNHWAKNEIHTLVQNNVINKLEYGQTYQPNKNITRLEMAKMIVRALGLDEQAKKKAGDKTKFSDNSNIPSNDRGYIIIASDSDIISGYPDKTFKPNGQATRAEASAMTVRALEYLQNINEEEIPKGEVIKAEDLPKKSFEEEGIDAQVIPRISVDINRYRFKPKEIVDARIDLFPIEYEGLKITSYRMEEYEDTFVYGTNSYYWGIGRPIDLFMVEAEVIKEISVSAYEVTFLDENNNMIKKKPTYYIDGYRAHEPMEIKALENYPNLPVSQYQIGTRKSSGKVDLMFALSSEEADRVKTVLLYYKGHEQGLTETDVLKITLD